MFELNGTLHRVMLQGWCSRSYTPLALVGRCQPPKLQASKSGCPRRSRTPSRRMRFRAPHLYCRSLLGICRHRSLELALSSATVCKMHRFRFEAWHSAEIHPLGGATCTGSLSSARWTRSTRPPSSRSAASRCRTCGASTRVGWASSPLSSRRSLRLHSPRT